MYGHHTYEAACEVRKRVSPELAGSSLSTLKWAKAYVALNAPGAGEGSTYYIYAKDPSIQAFTDLMNRALDKPKEQKQEVEITGEPELIAALMGGRQRAAKAKEGK